MKKSGLQLFLKFAQLLLPYWKLEALIGSLTALGVAVSLITPYLTKLMIDQGLGKKDTKLFLALAATATAMLIVNGLATRFVNYLNEYIRARVNFDLTRRIFEKLQGLPLGFFRDKTTGEHLFKTQYDIHRAVDIVVTMLPQALGLMPRFVLIFVIIFRLDQRISALVILLAPLTFVAPYFFTKKLQKTIRQYIQSSQEIFIKLGEIFSHIYLVKVFSKEMRERENYTRLMKDNLRLKRKNIGLEVSSQFYASLAQRSVLGLVVLYGGWRVIEGDMTLGSLTAITVYLTQLVSMQGSFARFFQDAAVNLVSCERLKLVFDVTEPVVRNDSPPEDHVEAGEIRFKDVYFSYSDGRPVLEGIGFTIEPRSRVAIVGHSGVGKTTIINLLLRVDDVQAGTISIDGHNISDMEPSILKRQIGLAPQEPLLWNETVMNNIRYGREDATDEDVYWAARLAQADEFILELPQKYRTVIGENACKISEGQKQRISIARALIKKPRILILDEAMASLDTELEDAILADIERELKDATLIVVTHRRSTLARMDAIYHLECSRNISATDRRNHIPEDRVCREDFSSRFIV